MSRIRLSESQFAMFQQPAPTRKGGPRAPRQRKPKEQLPENIVESQIVTFLRAHGWTVKKLHVGTFVPVGMFLRLLEKKGKVEKEDLFRSSVRIGEPGESDYEVRRPRIPTGARPEDGPWPQDYFLLEVKAPGRKPEAEQLTFLAAQRATGTMAWWVNEFEDDGFETLDPHISHVFLRWFNAWFGGAR